MRQLAAYAAVIAGVFSAAVLAGAGVAMLAIRRRDQQQEGNRS
jgi:uncharacterized membrane protein YagU involved in acid resistance